MLSIIFMSLLLNEMRLVSVISASGKLFHIWDPLERILCFAWEFLHKGKRRWKGLRVALWERSVKSWSVVIECTDLWIRNKLVCALIMSGTCSNFLLQNNSFVCPYRLLKNIICSSFFLEDQKTTYVCVVCSSPDCTAVMYVRIY